MMRLLTTCFQTLQPLLSSFITINTTQKETNVSFHLTQHTTCDVCSSLVTWPAWWLLIGQLETPFKVKRSFATPKKLHYRL